MLPLERRAWARRALAALGVTAALAGWAWTASVLATTQRDTRAFGDLASYEIAVIEASEGRRLVGQPARWGFHQPGASQFYMQVPLYLFSGQRSWALWGTALLVAIASALIASSLLARVVPSRIAFVAAAPLVFAWVLYVRPATFLNPWPQYSIVLPFVCFLLAAARCAAGHPAMGGVALAAGSYAVQGYASCLPAVAVVGLLAATLSARTAVRSAWRRHHLVAAIFVLGVFWLPTLVDALREGGNLARIQRYRDQASAPADRGEVAFQLATHIAGPWLAAGRNRVQTATDFSSTERHEAWFLAVVWVALVAIALLHARRRGQVQAAVLLALCLATMTMTLFSAAWLEGDPPRYVFLWTAGAALLGWIVAIASLAPSTSATATRAATSFAVLVCGVGVLTATALGIDRLPRVGDPIVSRVHQALESVDTGAGGVHFVAHDLAWIWGLPLLVEFHHAGHAVTIEGRHQGQPMTDLQGLMPRWMAPPPPSARRYELRLLRPHEPDPQVSLLFCEPVGPIVGPGRLCVSEAAR